MQVLSYFNCSDRKMGYYADVETNCRAYHTCYNHGNNFIRYCPENTAFRQDATICDHAYRINCRMNVENILKTLRSYSFLVVATWCQYALLVMVGNRKSPDLLDGVCLMCHVAITSCGMEGCEMPSVAALLRPVNIFKPSISNSNSSINTRSNFRFDKDNYTYTSTQKFIKNNRTHNTWNVLKNSLNKSTDASVRGLSKMTTVYFVSNNIDNDPYYPKSSITTEIYHSSNYQIKKLKNPYFIMIKVPLTRDDNFKIPSILTNFDCLKDLLDRRKLFFIQRIVSV
ncbi:PREDICTED: uncharacterized protein LOC105365959 [Ceratosolen solmsi marchali]|uniref:Uncharacterized protein LOC105365959 n=1 Tax=Ceratosolen solmsi marchali TaxID=326594 RepID=A0AAJ7DZX5_9HYME|nr:PREDICTED: uncharacterized protein LOC105365959 [Ceratosolen solmsi marchali]